MTEDVDVRADAYAAVRDRCLAIGRSISDDEAATMSLCCPAWSVKDLFAHMTGVASDIVTGNLEGAATEAWADAQVAARIDRPLADICDEWADVGAQVEATLQVAADAFPPQFYIDAWTHEWDIRQALGSVASTSPDMRLLLATRSWLAAALNKKFTAAGAPAVELTLTGEAGPWSRSLGEGEPTAAVEMPLFEFGRITMGRRSAAQIEAIVGNLEPSLFVFWSINDQDIVDPT